MTAEETAFLRCIVISHVGIVLRSYPLKVNQFAKMYIVEFKGHFSPLTHFLLVL